MSTEATSFQNLWFGCGFSICWSTNPVVSTCLVVGPNSYRRDFRSFWVGSPSCWFMFRFLLGIWKGQDIEQQQWCVWEQYDAIKPIEIWEQLHQLMSRDTILQAKSPEAPGATTRWSSTPDGIFDQVAWRTGGFTGVFLDCLRLILFIFCDGSISLCRWYVDEGCHDVLQAYCLLNFKDVILQCSKSGVVQGGYSEPSTDSGYFH